MIMPPTPTCFNHIVAFEVSKAELVVHTLPADCQQRIDNKAAAVRRLLKVSPEQEAARASRRSPKGGLFTGRRAARE